MEAVDAVDRDAVTGAELHPLLAHRWSPRGFDPQYTLSDADLHTLLEGARWAPSSGNSQPWRFVVSRRGDEIHPRLVKHLVPGNQLWAPSASMLMLAAALTVRDDGKVLGHAWYDTGQAVAHLSIQAGALGLAVHQMGGFDRDGVRAEFALPAHVEPIAMVAVGRYDPEAALPEPLWSRERAPRERKAVSEILLP
ncbi:MAG TPA: nitroreductase family protein [Sporichthyaceae bacterium]|jgi:nitroreductase|nr:nitroreductase family protein [Sporichthyaceae bacterium]